MAPLLTPLLPAPAPIPAPPAPAGTEEEEVESAAGPFTASGPARFRSWSSSWVRSWVFIHRVVGVVVVWLWLL